MRQSIYFDLLEEYKHLEYSLKELGELIESIEKKKNNTIYHSVKTPLTVLVAQYKSMFQYLLLLEERIKLERVDLNELD